MGELIPSPTSASKIYINSLCCNEGGDGSNISIYGSNIPFEGGQIALISMKFAMGKIIYLITTDAKALRVFFLLPFELRVHNLPHYWSFTKRNSVECSDVYSY